MAGKCRVQNWGSRYGHRGKWQNYHPVKHIGQGHFVSGFFFSSSKFKKMKTYSFGDVKPITFKEVKRLYGQNCQVQRIQEYWIEGQGWIKAEFTEPVEAQINRVILMGATHVQLEIKIPGHTWLNYADYRITELQEKTE